MNRPYQIDALQRAWEAAHEKAGMTTTHLFRAADLPRPPDPIEDLVRTHRQLEGMPPRPDLIVIKHHPEDAGSVQALVKQLDGMGIHKIETVEAEDATPGDPEVYLFNRPPGGLLR